MRFVFLSLVVLVLAFVGCGASSLVPPPEAGTLFLDVPEDAPVFFDGLPVGFGPRTMTVLLNWPNYLQVGNWRLVVWSAAGLDTLSLRGDPARDLNFVSPERVGVSR